MIPFYLYSYFYRTNTGTTYTDIPAPDLSTFGQSRYLYFIKYGKYNDWELGVLMAFKGFHKTVIALGNSSEKLSLDWLSVSDKKIVITIPSSADDYGYMGFSSI